MLNGTQNTLFAVLTIVLVTLLLFIHLKASIKLSFRLRIFCSSGNELNSERVGYKIFLPDKRLCYQITNISCLVMKELLNVFIITD
jgi:hypothetical protein